MSTPALLQLLQRAAAAALVVLASLPSQPALAQTTSPASASGLPASPQALPAIGVPTLESSRSGADTGTRAAGPATVSPTEPDRSVARREPPPPSEFQLYVQRLAGAQEVRRFGARLVAPGADSTGPDYNPIVPPEYVVQVGDEIALAVWGAVDADLRLVVDRSGRINVPRVGSVLVAGLRYGDLADTLRRRIGQTFKNFDLSVSLGQLRGIRIYVTGFVMHPGPVTVNALAGLTAAIVRAGGPSPAGSLRDIELRRGGSVVAHFDLYDLLIGGTRAGDVLLQPGDVIRVAPIGTQVAVIGSVNQPGVFELKPGETLKDLLRYGGGLTATANRTRLTLERLDDRASTRVVELALPAALGDPLRDADVVRAFSAVDVVLPVARQNKRVHVEGEVARPGDYLLPPSSTLADAVRAAGGLTAAAYLYGADFTRVSVREQQEQNYERALRDMETNLTRLSTGQRVASPDEAAAQSARAAATTRLIERLRAVKPTGRVVLQLTPESTTLPELALEDGDRLYIPARPVTVGVFGSVFNPGSYLFAPERDLGHYLRLAGGPTRGADKQSLFVVRANGTVASALQGAGWFGVGDAFWNQTVEPGDTIFAPEQIDRTTLVQDFKDWTQILYQFGLGVAGLKVLGVGF